MLCTTGVIAVGLFADNPIPLDTTSGRKGLFKGGGWYLLGIQSLSALCLTCWGVCSTFALLWMINKLIPIRMDPNEELLGADLMEHRIRHSQIGLSRALSALQPLNVDLSQIAGIPPIGMNPRHDEMLQEIKQANEKLNQWQAYYDQMTPKKSSRNRAGGGGGGISLKSAGNLFKRRKTLKPTTTGKQLETTLTTGGGGAPMPGTYVSTREDLVKVSTVSAATTTDPKTTDGGVNNFAWVD